MQTTAARTRAAERALLIFRIELALLTDDFPTRDVEVERTDDAAAVSGEMPVTIELLAELVDTGVKAASAPTVDHVAAELAALSP